MTLRILAACIGISAIGAAAAQPAPESESVADERNAPPPLTRTSELRVFDIDGNRFHSLGEHEGFLPRAQFLPDGRRVSIREPEGQVYLLLDAETGETVGHAGGEDCGDQPVWSPSGVEFAFSALRGSRSTIFRCTADGENFEAEMIYAHDGEVLRLDDWSADGRYLAMSSTAGRLYRLDLEAAHVPDVLIKAELPIRRSRFSPDGRFLAYLASLGGRFELRLTRAEPDPDGDQNYWTIASDVSAGAEVWWDHDDPALYFLDSLTRLVAVPIDTSGDEPEIGPAQARFALSDLQLSPLLFALSADGERVLTAQLPREPEAELQQIAIVNLEGDEIARLGKPGNYLFAVFSPDGSRILTAIQEANEGNAFELLASGGRAIRVLSIDVESGAATTVLEESALSAALRLFRGNNFVWLPDSEHVAYAVDSTSSNEGAFTWIYRARVDGTGKRDGLYRSTRGVSLSVADFSSDGRYLLFDSFGWVATVPLTGNDPVAREPVDLVREEYEAEQPRLSPDMQLVAYLYNETGDNELYLAPFDAATGATKGERIRVSEDGASEILGWRSDGGLLYYISGDSPFGPFGGNFRAGNAPGPGGRNPPAVMAVSVTTESSLEIGEPQKVLDNMVESVGPDGQRFVKLVPAASEE